MVYNTPLEAEEQKNLVTWLKMKGIPFYAIPNSQNMSPGNRKRAAINMRRLKAQGLSPGVPDLCLFLPEFAVYIELKRVMLGRVSPTQEAWLDTINAFPYSKGFVCHGWYEAKELIEDLLA